MQAYVLKRLPSEDLVVPEGTQVELIPPAYLPRHSLRHLAADTIQKLHNGELRAFFWKGRLWVVRNDYLDIPKYINRRYNW